MHYIITYCRTNSIVYCIARWSRCESCLIKLTVQSLQGFCNTTITSIMIDLCQWRAAIGLWNCRSTSKSQVHAVQTRCSKEESNEISQSCLRSTTGSAATAQSGHIFAVSDESDSALNIKWNESHFFATTDDDFFCFFLWLFLHILLLLSGDIELNPGPVTDVLKEGRKKRVVINVMIN